jgi:mannose-6-phosphate isomerase-like protein (cupin superfamily)
VSRAFPGGTSVTHLSVYSGICPDGLAGGTPHLHTASTEAYVVIEGNGALQTLDPSGLHETPLEPGSTVWFTPGTIHRAIGIGLLAFLGTGEVQHPPGSWLLATALAVLLAIAALTAIPAMLATRRPVVETLQSAPT